MNCGYPYFIRLFGLFRHAPSFSTNSPRKLPLVPRSLPLPPRPRREVNSGVAAFRGRVFGVL